ncbi:MAG TPA: hypothetical protein VGG31_04735 [Candidatus Dormibacteraeota bacterium]
MRTRSLFRAVIVVVLLATACSASPAGVARVQTASATRTASQGRTAAPSGILPSPTVGALGTQGGSCPSLSPPVYAPSKPSPRNVLIVWMKGSESFAIRDITDILQPRTISTFDSLGVPQLITPSELSYAQGDLVRMPLSGKPRTVVAKCVMAPWFAWSPDGTSAAYMSTSPRDDTVFDLHVVTGGHNRVVASTPMQTRSVGCESRVCADRWDVRLQYSPDGAYISLVQMVPVGALRIWTAGGTLVKQLDSGTLTMSAWSGNSLYWMDDKGIEVWRSGTQSLALPAVSWIRPHGSPAGGQIVYETRDPGYSTAHVFLLDTGSGRVHQIAASRSEPAFLNSHLIWYKEERPCAASDGCTVGPTTETGRTFIYDLADGTETESVIAAVFDAWPHPA